MYILFLYVKEKGIDANFKGKTFFFLFKRKLSRNILQWSGIAPRVSTQYLFLSSSQYVNRHRIQRTNILIIIWPGNKKPQARSVQSMLKYSDFCSFVRSQQRTMRTSLFLESNPFAIIIIIIYTTFFFLHNFLRDSECLNISYFVVDCRHLSTWEIIRTYCSICVKTQAICNIGDILKNNNNNKRSKYRKKPTLQQQQQQMFVRSDDICRLSFCEKKKCFMRVEHDFWRKMKRKKWCVTKHSHFVIHSQ